MKPERLDPRGCVRVCFKVELHYIIGTLVSVVMSLSVCVCSSVYVYLKYGCHQLLFPSSINNLINCQPFSISIKKIIVWPVKHQNVANVQIFTFDSRID